MLSLTERSTPLARSSTRCVLIYCERPRKLVHATVALANASYRHTSLTNATHTKVKQKFIGYVYIPKIQYILLYRGIMFSIHRCLHNTEARFGEVASGGSNTVSTVRANPRLPLKLKA